MKNHAFPFSENKNKNKTGIGQIVSIIFSEHVGEEGGLTE